ncbi:Cleavage stimulation factor subunit 3 [Morella rubra]|uniref:Cleavage stimulation factor subunit 3 n=1 Tax=Morella rubra TaxID=262757 RepID=A0A6A1V4M6_9ROSI|nr:Cleavage stimulation factor subunit 3 [Morella rubra]KAB1206807.1 Cleavage stimulation factor subunit 3 [Morella rubra]
MAEITSSHIRANACYPSLDLPSGIITSPKRRLSPNSARTTRCYIRFIRKVNEKKGLEGQEETRKAFDFMLSYIGADTASGPVWMEYITFLKSLPAQNTQEESQRMIAVRKVYQKAIITPTHHIEQLWREYENFENSVSRQLAKGLLSEYQPKYNSARAVYRERKKYVDEIDWNMLAVPPSGSYKAIFCFLGNPQRIDSASSNKRIMFTYEQCLMYLYHYPDIWYDYATWHAKSGSVDAAVKVFQRALKALPDSEMLRYAYAELEESRGAIQSTKKIYESLLGDRVNTTTLAHIQFIRFLRRTEGVEAARKYFLDARKSPNCTYHVYVAYAMMAFCLDKDREIAHNVFEAGLKRFMHEPVYILEYADFLTRLNDDRNIRALFERALSSLPPEESVEVWKRFTQFEQTYGDLASMLKVEQRRKEALSRTGEEGASALEGSLQDVVSRYSFMDLWPCTSKDLDHLAWQEWLAKNINKKVEKWALPNGPGSVDKVAMGLLGNSAVSAKIVYPDISNMVIKAPGALEHEGLMESRCKAPQSTSATLADLHPMEIACNDSHLNSVRLLKLKKEPNDKNSIGLEKETLPSTTASGVPAAFSNLSNPTVAPGGGGTMNAFDEILKATPPTLVAFLASLPAIEDMGKGPIILLATCLSFSQSPHALENYNMEHFTQIVVVNSVATGPTPDVDVVLSICLQSDIPVGQTGKSGTSQGQLLGGPASGRSDLSGSSKTQPIPSISSFKPARDRQSGKRRDLDRQEEEETASVQSQPLPRDVFRMRQIQKARGSTASKARVTTSQTGSASYGSALSGDLSGISG